MTLSGMTIVTSRWKCHPKANQMTGSWPASQSEELYQPLMTLGRRWRRECDACHFLSAPRYWPVHYGKLWWKRQTSSLGSWTKQFCRGFGLIYPDWEWFWNFETNVPPLYIKSRPLEPSGILEKPPENIRIVCALFPTVQWLTTAECPMYPLLGSLSSASPRR